MKPLNLPPVEWSEFMEWTACVLLLCAIIGGLFKFVELVIRVVKLFLS